MQMTLKAPFPWFGGKSRVAHLVWERFGDVSNYVEPFFGSGAVLLSRPGSPGIETVNDKDAFLANFWRAIQHDPEQTASFADWPVNETDLLARHRWLKRQHAELKEHLENDPEAYDPKIAGWWVWGLSAWIGGGWCAESDVRVHRQRPHLRHWGTGVHHKLPHLGRGKGVPRSRPHLGDAGKGVHRSNIGLHEYFMTLADRLRNVRVCCGDWTRVLGPSPTFMNGVTGVFLDPPYSHDLRDDGCYATETDCSAEVRQWAIDNGSHPLLRIALCGYQGEHEMPSDWCKVPWKAHGGYGSRGDGRGRANAMKERIWFSPACLNCELFRL